jgi:hypothetical protein
VVRAEVNLEVMKVVMKVVTEREVDVQAVERVEVRVVEEELTCAQI